jgi:hypothetical protein
MKCKICSAEFERVGRQIYCSEDCHRLSQSKKHRRMREVARNLENMEKFRRFLGQNLENASY